MHKSFIILSLIISNIWAYCLKIFDFKLFLKRWSHFFNTVFYAILDEDI